LAFALESAKAHIAKLAGRLAEPQKEASPGINLARQYARANLASSPLLQPEARAEPEAPVGLAKVQEEIENASEDSDTEN